MDDEEQYTQVSEDQAAEHAEEWIRLGAGTYLVRHTTAGETSVFWAIEQPDGTYQIGGLD